MALTREEARKVADHFLQTFTNAAEGLSFGVSVAKGDGFTVAVVAQTQRLSEDRLKEIRETAKDILGRPLTEKETHYMFMSLKF